MHSYLDLLPLIGETRASDRDSYQPSAPPPFEHAKAKQHQAIFPSERLLAFGPDQATTSADDQQTLLISILSGLLDTDF